MGLNHSYTKFLGILGRGIGYSLSPFIHNKSIEMLGRGEVYLIFDAESEDWSRVLSSLWDLGCVGFNVTTPYKQLMATLTHAPIPAVNTVYRGKDSWKSCSTDGMGFERALRRAGYDLGSFTNIVILGGGGASLSLVHHLSSTLTQPLKVSVLRRGTGNDQAFLQLNGNPHAVELHPFAPAVLERCLASAGNTLLVQATNASPKDQNFSEFAGAMTKLNGYFFDLVYANPTSLLAEAKKRGIPNQDGLTMLVEQALASQKMWWGESAEFETIFGLVKAYAGLK
ncbi:MAG: shikimate dehydrogenase [Oligoflexales bacterium]